jgi:uncharacterized protein (TIGR03382 family)
MAQTAERVMKHGRFACAIGAAISALAFGGPARAGPVDACLATMNDSGADHSGGDMSSVPAHCDSAADGRGAETTFKASDPAFVDTIGVWFHPEGGLDSFRADPAFADWSASDDHVLLGESNSATTFVPAPGALALGVTALLVGLSRRRGA